TRVTDKRKVRRDLADFFCTVAEGVKGKRAVEWKLVDAVAPKSRWDEEVQARAKKLAAKSDRPGGEGVKLTPLEVNVDGDVISYKYVTLRYDRAARTAELVVRAPGAEEKQPENAEKMRKKGAELW